MFVYVLLQVQVSLERGLVSWSYPFGDEVYHEFPAPERALMISSIILRVTLLVFFQTFANRLE